MTQDRRTFLGAGGVALVSLLAGCGSGADDDQTPSPSPTATPTPTETATPSPTPTATPEAAPAQERYPSYEWRLLDGVAPVATTAIRMRGFEFHPLVAAVEPGAELTVTNGDEGDHSFTVSLLGIDEHLRAGDTTSVVLDQTGTFDYVCDFHPPEMLGRLVVTEDLPTPTPTATPTPTPTPTATPTPTPTATPVDDDDDDDDGGGGGY